MDDIKKLYYSISEVADMLGREPHVLRYWESEFEELQPKKNRAGNRVYTQEDINLLKRIQHLLEVDKYTLAGARRALKKGKEPVQDDESFRVELERIRSFLQEMLDQI